MTIQSDNLGFLIGKPIKLNGVDENLDAIEKNTRELVAIFKNGQRIERRIVAAKPFVPKLSTKSVIDAVSRPVNPVNKPSESTRQVKSDVVYQVKRTGKAIVKQNGEEFDLMPKAQAHIATLGARNNKGQFVSTQKPAVSPYGKSMAGVLTKQQEKQEFKEKRQWRLDLFKFMRKSDKDNRRERKKSDGLLSKIAGKAIGGARYAAGGAAGWFGGSVLSEAADVASGGLSVLGKGGRILKGGGKLLKGGVKTLGRGGKLLKGGIAGILGGLLLDGATDKLKDGGHKTAAAGTDIASSALTGASIGGTIGSVVPVVGTGVGAAIGGALGGLKGVYDNWEVVAKFIKPDWKSGWDKVRNGMSWTFGGMTDSIKTVSGYAWDGMRSFWGTTWSGVGALFPDMTKNVESIFASMSSLIVSGANSAWDSITTWAKGATNWVSKKWEEAKAGYNGEAMPTSNNAPAPQALPDSLKDYANADLGSFKRKEVTIDAADLHGYGTHKEKQVRYVKKGRRVEGGGSTKDVELTESQYSQVKGYQEQVAQYNADAIKPNTTSWAYNAGQVAGSIKDYGSGVYKNGVFTLTEQDIEDLKKVAATEVVASLKGKNKYEQTAGVIDTVINRAVVKGKSIRQVINEKGQFSDINTNRKTAYGSVQNVPESRVKSSGVSTFVEEHLKNRARGSDSIVGGNTYYANPNFLGEASKATKRWVADVESQAKASGQVFGSGNAIHVHGTPNGEQRAPKFGISLNDSSPLSARQLSEKSIQSTGSKLSNPQVMKPYITPVTKVSMPKVAIAKPMTYDVQNVSASSTKPVKLNSGNKNGSTQIQASVLATQNVNDRMLAHVASGGIGWNNIG